MQREKWREKGGRERRGEEGRTGKFVVDEPRGHAELHRIVRCNL